MYFHVIGFSFFVTFLMLKENLIYPLFPNSYFLTAFWKQYKTKLFLMVTYHWLTKCWQRCWRGKILKNFPSCLVLCSPYILTLDVVSPAKQLSPGSSSHRCSISIRIQRSTQLLYKIWLFSSYVCERNWWWSQKRVKAWEKELVGCPCLVHQQNEGKGNV